MNALLDDYLLELILMDTFSIAGHRCIPDAERIIQQFIPEGLYDRIIARYDELSDEGDDTDPSFLRRWLSVAASKDPPWKRKMIRRFLAIARRALAASVGSNELVEVASLAAAMGAASECRQVLVLDFGANWLCR